MILGVCTHKNIIFIAIALSFKTNAEWGRRGSEWWRFNTSAIASTPCVLCIFKDNIIDYTNAMVAMKSVFVIDIDALPVASTCTNPVLNYKTGESDWPQTEPINDIQLVSFNKLWWQIQKEYAVDEPHSKTNDVGLEPILEVFVPKEICSAMYAKDHSRYPMKHLLKSQLILGSELLEKIDHGCGKCMHEYGSASCRPEHHCSSNAKVIPQALWNIWDIPLLLTHNMLSVRFFRLLFINPHLSHHNFMLFNVFIVCSIPNTLLNVV